MSTETLTLLQPRDKHKPASYAGYSEQDLVRLLNELGIQRDAVATAIENQRQSRPTASQGRAA